MKSKQAKSSLQLSPAPEGLKGYAARLAAGECTPRELAEETRARCAASQVRLNAFTALHPAATSSAEPSAAVPDDASPPARQRMKTVGLDLHGIPVAHKDIFCESGWVTSCGSRMLANFVSPYDAAVVERCRAAGLVTLAHTNMDEFAMGSSNEHSVFGAVRNPWDLRAVPGGSSGGSAAAVAARLVPAATGTDTGGSIRQPAAFCGIVGIKPSYGRVSRYGMVAYASSLDQAGVFALDAEDAATLLTRLAGHDARDATSLPHAPEDFTRLLVEPREGLPLAGLRIGLPREYFSPGVASQGLAAAVREAIETALEEYRALGARTVEISLPRSEYAIAAYYVIASAEASSNLSRYDGVRYGYRSARADSLELDPFYALSRSEGFGAEVKSRILMGTYVLSHGYYDAYYLQAQKVRRLIAEDFQRAFDGCDLIAAPVAPTVAWDLGEKTQDPVAMYLADIYTLGVNLAGLPALSHPIGFSTVRGSRRPIGLQLIAPYLQEARLLDCAHRYQQVSDWHRQAPRDDAVA